MSKTFKPIVSESGNLTGAYFDEQVKELFVKFKDGKCAKYPNFDAELNRQFEERFDGKHTESAGKFFYKHIRHLPFEYV